MNPITTKTQKNKADYQVLVQRAVRKVNAPASAQLKKWAISALLGRMPSAELTIRLVGIKEMTHLNSTYRHKNGPTNILSFPFDEPHETDSTMPLLGDLVICAEVVNQEALDQNKLAAAHWAHMVIHGTLHLLGYDHENEADALKMEAEEIGILDTLEIPNPYHINKKGESS